MIISWLQDDVLDPCLFLALGIVITIASNWVNNRNTIATYIGGGCSSQECCSITPPPCLQAHSELADGKMEVERHGEA